MKKENKAVDTAKGTIPTANQDQDIINPTKTALSEATNLALRPGYFPRAI